MTDTGQIPGEGLPENAGVVEQPGMQAPGAYTFLDPSENGPEEDDLLLMPGAQGAWSDPQTAQQAPPLHQGEMGHAQPQVAEQYTVSAQVAPAQMAEHHAVQHHAVQQQAAQQQFAAVQAPAGPEFAVPTDLGSPDAAVAPTSMGSAEFAAAPPTDLGSPDFAAAPDFAAPGIQPVAEQAQVFRPASAIETVAGLEQQAVDGYAGAPAQAAPAHGTPEYDPENAQETGVHETGAHEAGGRNSGHVDLNGVRIPPASAAPTPPPRRPLHMGPPMPESSGGVVRSLADRGPAGTAPHPLTVQNHPGPPTTGPEYLDIPQSEAASVLPGPQLGEIPPQAGAPWDPQPPQAHTQTSVPAETVVPEATPDPAVTPDASAAPVAAVVEEAPEPLPEQAAEGQFVPVEGSLPSAEHPEPTPVAEPAQLDAVQEQAPEAVAEVESAPELVSPPEAESAPELVSPPELVEETPAPEPVVVETPDAVAAPEAVVPAQREGEPESFAVQEQAPVVEVPVVPEPLAEPQPIADVAEPEPVADQPVAEVQPDGEAAPEPAPEAPADAAPQPAGEDAADEEPAAEEPEQTPVGSAPAPAYDDAEREAVLRVMRERRDIRNGFRSDPIPHEVLLRVLEAAHTAPSVGHSQPWDFVVIRSAETRRTMHELAQRQREAYAKSLPKGRAKQFKELKIEAILDTPVNIVVTADPTRGGRHTLGRHTQPQMAPYSSALAVENLWLAARAEGLGVGWVSFFDEREMVRTLGLPEHLEVVAYLCVGYVDEFPQEPELMQAGWSKRRPLSWVVHEETYGRRALPGEAPHDLLQETVANIRPLDAKALGEAWERQKRMTKPAGALGMLEIISAQLSGLSRMCPPPIPEPAAVAIFAGDHGVHAQGVTSWPQEVTGQMVANFLGGGAVCNAFANQVGAEVCVIDVGVASDLPATPGLLPRKVRAGTADFTTGPALSREDVLSAIEVGIETARDLVAAGNKGLLTGEMGIANTTVSAALISVYTGIDPGEITGRGTGINDEMHARKVDVVRRALELHAPDPADPVGVLSAVGGLEHAALVGFILGGASLRTPVVLDGVSAGAAALVARAIAPEALAACIAGHRSAEPGHVAALNKLGLRPLVDLDLRLGEGTGALLALPVVQSAARAMHEVATFDSAGVTEK